MVVAEILRARGTQGEVVALSQTDVPGRFASLKRVNARLVDGTDIALEISAAWPHKGNWVLKFNGFDSIETAEKLRGAEVWVPFTERGALAAGEFFQSDLVGCRVFDTATGACVGVVQGWQEYGGPPLMEVEFGGREALVPFVSGLSTVDLAANTIYVDLPEGLIDL